jgi:polysaccharide export outer membrane protein
VSAATLLAALAVSGPATLAQSASPTDAVTSAVPTPAGYVIGVDDVLSVLVWNEKDMSADVMVRPDGRISLPLLKEVEAVGLTPEQLSARLAEVVAQFLNDPPQVTVMVKEIKSRKVYVLGEVARPGVVPLNVDMNVLQVLSASGGLLEWAKKGDIVVVRTDKGVETRLKFNYNDAIKGKNPKQNVMLQPGDLVVVP